MQKIAFAALGLLALAGCGGAANDVYPFSLGETRERLLNGVYEKGSLKGFSSHNIKPVATSDTRIEWHVMTDGGNGIFCESLLEPAGEDNGQTLVKTGCQMKMPEKTMQKLVHSTLTGEPFVKDN